MATSGSYDNTNTMATIIRDAYTLIGVLDDGESLDAAMESYGKRMLNNLMSVFSTHKGLWLVDDVEFVLTPGTQSYTVGDGLDIDVPRPMRVPDSRRKISSSLEIQMEVVSRREYMQLPNKSLQAPALSVYFDQRRDNSVLYVWPTGSATEKTIVLTMQRPVQDFDEAGDNPDLPKEWVLPLIYALAVKLSPKYLGGIVPPDIKAESLELLNTLIGYDEEEVSINFQPGDYR